MNFDPKSISDHIECLARLTGAPSTFIAQVKALFERKGILLSADAAPYLKALDEAFRREETIRSSTRRANKAFVPSQKNFSKIGQAYVKQAERLRDNSDELRERTRRVLGGAAPAKRKRSQSIAVQGDHRSYITSAQRDELPMVPGPKEVQ